MSLLSLLSLPIVHCSMSQVCMHGHCIFRKSFTNWSAKWLWMWNLWHLCHLCRSGWPGMRVQYLCFRNCSLWGRRRSWGLGRCPWCRAFRPFRASRTAPAAALTDLGGLLSRIRVRTTREIGREITHSARHIRHIRHISLSSSFSDFLTFLLSYNFSLCLMCLMCLFRVSPLGLCISFSRLVLDFFPVILNSSNCCNDRETLGRWISAATMAWTSTFDPSLGSFGLVSGSLTVGRRPGSRNVPQEIDTQSEIWDQSREGNSKLRLKFKAYKYIIEVKQFSKLRELRRRCGGRQCHRRPMRWRWSGSDRWCSQCITPQTTVTRVTRTVTRVTRTVTRVTRTGTPWSS